MPTNTFMPTHSNKLLNFRAATYGNIPTKIKLESEAIFIEFKLCQTPSASAIDKAIRKAKKQAPYILLEIDCDIRPQILISGIEDRCQRDENQEVIKQIWLLWQDELFQFSREEIVDKSWISRLKIK